MRSVIWLISFGAMLGFCCAQPNPSIEQYHERISNDKEAADRFNQIHAAYNKADYRTTIIQGESFLDRYGQTKPSARVCRYVGDAYYRLDEYELAVSFYERFVKSYPEHEDLSEVYRALGYAYLALNNTFGAGKNFLAHLTLNPQSSENKNIITLIRSRVLDSVSLKECRQLGHDYPATEVSDEFAYRVIRADYADGRFEDVSSAASQFIINYPRSPHFNEVNEIKNTLPGQWKSPSNASDAYTAYPPDSGLYPPSTAVGLKIGVICPVSGQYARFGAAVLKGVELAIDDFRLESGFSVELMIRDSKGSAVEALKASQDLIYKEGVIGIIGPVLSETVSAAASVAQQAGVPLITPTATDTQIKLTGDHIFQLNNTNTELALALAKYAITVLNITNVSILHPTTSYGADMTAGFSGAFREMGGVILDVIAYPADQADFQEQIKTLKANQPQALFIPAQVDDLLLIVPQLNYYEFYPQLLGGNGWNSEKLLRLEGKHVQNAYFVDSYFALSVLESFQRFKARFLQRYGEEPDKVAALSYDAARFFATGIHDRQMGAVDLFRNLQQNPLHNGITGHITYGPDGRIFKYPLILKVENGLVVETFWTGN